MTTVVIRMPAKLLRLVALRPQDHLTQEECAALLKFQEDAEQILTYCEEHPQDKGVVHEM